MSEKRDLLKEIEQFLELEEELYGPLILSNPSSSITGSSNHKTKPLSGGSSINKQPSFLRSEEDPDHGGHTSGDLLTPQSPEHCSTLDELRNYCLGLPDLKTDLADTNLVFGVGNPHADLMIIGEAPGAEEDRKGEPFVGDAGELLDKIVSAIGFKREEIYIANILKHRPPGNRNPSPEEIERSLPVLYRQIDLVEPKIILCVGKVPGTTLLGRDESISRLRGRFYPFRGAQLTVTYHPAALLRNPKWKRPVWEDVQKVRRRYDELGGKP